VTFLASADPNPAPTPVASGHGPFIVGLLDSWEIGEPHLVGLNLPAIASGASSYV
jgi:hypothetical protein